MIDDTRKLAMEVVRMGEQMTAVAHNVKEIKAKVEAMAQMEKTLAEQKINDLNASKEIETIWMRIDEDRKARTELDTRIVATNSSIEALINKGRGALWVATVMMGILQAMIIGTVGWAAARIIDSDKTIATQQHRIERLERQTEKGAIQHGTY